MSNIPLSPYESRLVREVEEIEARIKELTDEKNALMRQIIKARWESNALKDVSRKNSGNRVMIESRVIDALNNTSTPCSTSELYKEALNANFELKYNTFRIYLHRMKERGLIKSTGWGRWSSV